KRYGRLIFIIIVFGVPIIVFLDVPFAYRLIIVVVFVCLVFSSMLEMVVNKNQISIKYPFSILVKEVIHWKDITMVEVVYRSGLTHGARMPSYIRFIAKNESKKIDYRLSKEELNNFEEVVKLKGVKFKCINNPYEDTLF